MHLRHGILPDAMLATKTIIRRCLFLSKLNYQFGCGQKGLSGCNLPTSCCSVRCGALLPVLDLNLSLHHQPETTVCLLKNDLPHASFAWANCYAEARCCMGRATPTFAPAL